MNRLFDHLEPRQLFAAGSLDASFGGDGSVTVQTNTRTYGINGSDAFVDDKGRTLVAGLYNKHKQMTVTRINANGTVDAHFGKNGIATIPLPSTASHSTFQVSADHTGRVLLMYGNYLVRLTSTGAIDRHSGFGGKNAEVNVPVVSETTDLAFDAYSNVIIIGTSAGKAGTRGTVLKLDSLGKLDTTFGSGGAYKTPVPTKNGKSGNATMQTLKVLTDGRIIGISRQKTRVGPDDTYQGISAFRLSSSGRLDSSYGTSGTLTVLLDDNDLDAENVTFDAFTGDGGMFIGQRYLSRDDDHGNAGFAQVDANGHVLNHELDLDLSLNLLPTAVQTYSGESYYLKIAAVQSDGKLIIQASDKLFRLNTDFSLDATYTEDPHRPLFAVNDGRALQRGDEVIMFGPLVEADLTRVYKTPTLTVFASA